MCVGAPMRVLRLLDVDPDSGHLAAHCAHVDGISETVDLSLVGPVEPGQWLLVFLGAARERLTPARAEEIARALAGVAAVMRGDDPAGAFADLEADGPRLPPHLEAARRRGDVVA